MNLNLRFTVIAIVVLFMGYMAYQGLGPQKRLQYGIDLQGGSQLDFRFDFSKNADRSKELLTEAIGIIQERIDGFGLKDIIITPIGSDRFSVQVSAKDKNVVESIKDLITVLGKLEFRITVEPDAPNYKKYWEHFQKAAARGVDQANTIRPEDVNSISNGGDDYPHGLRWYPLSATGKKNYPLQRRPEGKDGTKEAWVLCQLDDLALSGNSLENVTHRVSQQGIGGDWVVTFGVEKNWQGPMSSLTSFESGEKKFMAIILNEKVDSAPILRSMLSDSGEISGGFTEDSARGLAAVLQAGALRQRPTLDSERTVAAELAGSAKRTGVLSTLIGFVLVLLIIAWLYLGPGLLANLALLLNLLILVGVLTWFDAVLTLPGIAGVVLTIGMAVDANILVFERIKEEKSKGRTVAQAITTGYDRALVTIVDSNLTTLITAYFLFQIGSGPVRGFGITLAIGIIASMFTALYVTRTFFAYLVKRGTIDEARMRGAFKVPSVAWMTMKRPGVIGSTIAIVAGVALFERVPDKKKYDLEFTKGSRLIVRFHHDVRLDEVRARLARLGEKDPLFTGTTVRVSAEGIGVAVGTAGGSSFELRSQEVGTQEEIDRFVEALREAFKADILPGPLKSTLESAGAGSRGKIYFRGEVEEAAVRTAFAHYNATEGQLGSASVEALAATPGSESAFKIAFLDTAATAEDRAAVALSVRRALARYDHETLKVWLEEQSKDPDKTIARQEELKADLKVLEEMEAPGPRYFAESDPFPFADRIDPFTAQEHRASAVRAIALSILGIILYVAFRFRAWVFGFAAVVALVHDVVVVLGIVALVNWLGVVDARLNLVTVAAFLTLIGYSINDTIVVFDRIRENRGSGRSRLSEIIDRSLNQTLSRTLRTTSTTWVVVATLLVMNWGANSTLEGFAFILCIGVLVGTYSSIFVASPTLLYLPWLWERSGSSTRAFLKSAAPWMLLAGLGLLLMDYVKGNLTGDWSRTGFVDVALAVPVGVFFYFLFHFVRFVLKERADGSPA